jgi:hypothetical protein
MSQLMRPRIHFGGMFETNVGTANNDDILDPPAVDTASVTVQPPGDMGDEEFRRWMWGRTTVGRSAQPGSIRAGWNYHGDGRCDFIDVSVTGIEPRDRSVDADDDPLIGARVRLGPAAMVDLDPKGFASTQIFADSLEIIRDGVLRVSGRPSRFHCRWLNLNRNLGAQGFTRASAVFHASIPNAKIEWEIGNSAALAEFGLQVERAAGVTVRFCLYMVAARLSDETLSAQHQAGEQDTNPAVGRVVGTLSPWQPGELASVAMGRLLVPTSSTISGKLPITLGTAVASVDDAARCVILDLVNTFPEADQSGSKAVLGDAMLRIRNGTTTVDIGPVPYDQATYEQTAGIVEVPFPSAAEAALTGGELVLVTAKGGELLAEAPVMVDSDDRCIYLQQGEAATARFVALARGSALGQSVRFTVLDEPGADARGRVVEFPDTIEVGGNSDNLLPLRAVNPGCTVIRLARGPGTRPLDTARDPYISVRVLPADDYRHLGDDEITFAFVYREVLRYYHLLHPAMSRVLDLSDESAVTGAAADGSLLGRTNPERWSRAGYMPRTRDLSAGKRRLLERWCRKVTGS